MVISGTRPLVTKIVWVAGVLNARILAIFPNLVELDCSNNALISLAELRSCPKLEVLNCSNSWLTSLADLENCPRLKTLYCNKSWLKSLAGIESCAQLEVLCCKDNRLESLAGIEGLAQLRELDCEYNQLKSLDGIECCTQIRQLRCRDNHIESLGPLVYLRLLTSLLYSNNPLNIQTVQVQRFLTRFEAPRRYSSRTHTQTVYTNSQNVHDLHVQKTVCESLARLLSDPKPEFTIEDITHSGLDRETVRLLQLYCSDMCVHSVHLLTYSELLSYVWARIVKHEHRDGLMRVLAEQVRDSNGKCFTGKFNRLVSVLAGFCDDIVIEISDNSQIGAIIAAAKQQIESLEENQYSPEAHVELAQILLLEGGYDAVTVQPWLDAIVGL